MNERNSAADYLAMYRYYMRRAAWYWLAARCLLGVANYCEGMERTEVVKQANSYRVRASYYYDEARKQRFAFSLVQLQRGGDNATGADSEERNGTR